jgi:primosomal protein N' (replication factor Y)
MSGKNLRLKSEVAARAIVAPIGDDCLATVWVDNSLPHLDHTFSYLVPGNLNEQVKVGSLVQVPFNGQELSALVIARSSAEGVSNLKSISSHPAPLPLVSQEIISLISAVAKRYAAHPFDIIRSAVPPRVAAVDKELKEVELTPAPTAQGLKMFLQLPPARDRSQLMAQKIGAAAQEGGVLAIFPDSSELEAVRGHLSKMGISPSILDSELSKSERYRSFMQIKSKASTIVLGTRSGIFAPVANLRNIFIYNEGSQHFYEQRSPGWNAREVALMRSTIERFNLTFIGFAPSLEVALLIERGDVELKRVKAKVAVHSIAASFGELLPSRAIPIVRKALLKSAVLMIVPLKGYAQAIRCSHCKSVSRCLCGGAHEKRSLASPIICNHCNEISDNWKCVWCANPTPALLSRGIERHLHDIASLFPNTPVRFSTSDHPISTANPGEIVLATPGMAPECDGGYQLVVILEGNRFLSQPDLRAEERVRELYFSSASLITPTGELMCVQDSGHSITSAVASWSFTPSISAELEQRSALSLPPHVRSVVLGSSKDEVSRLKSALLKAQEESRIPSESKVLGPIVDGDSASLILTAPSTEADLLVETIHEFIRRRSAAKKKLPSLRIDPYSLTH